MGSNCNSDFLHGPRDLYSHFFGCLRTSEREDFLGCLTERSRARILEEEHHVAQLRSIFEARQDTEEGRLLRRHKQSLRRWREVTRLKSSPQAPPHNVPNGHLTPDGEPPEDDPVDDELQPGYKNRNAKSINSKTYIQEAGQDVDIYSQVMFFKNSAPHTLDDFLPEEFPDQKMPLKQLLYDENPEKNPLLRPCPEDMIRYFHLPANDMKWVEDLMECYYGDSNEFEPGEHDWTRDEETSKTKSKILLDQEIWRGQQRGPSINDPVHTRSMRPRCDVTSTGEQSKGPLSAKNLVLFMPYLHWETYRGRALQARTIKSSDRGKRTITQRFSDIAKMKISQMTSSHTADSGIHKPRTRRPWRFKSMKYFTGQYSLNHLNTSNQPENPAECLGDVLLRAAAVATAMNFYTDKTLLENRLDLNPPLHPRRTLDQYYYWALKDIEAQDKSQVVYRATAPKEHLLHITDQRSKRDLECRECLQDIRAVPRLLMVDQLWLWILDGHTVITFFPARWGRNEDDNSDVHRRLRTRLKAVQKQEIHSAYDLAIIIIDQCSQVFFDRTAIRSLRPQVLEIFAHAIGDVWSFKQITSFNHFLEYTRMFSVAYKARSEKKSVIRHRSIIDINAEVKLLQEIKDILDELNIMTTLLREQQTVCKTFTRHIQSILRGAVAEAEAKDELLDPPSEETARARKRYKETLERAGDLLTSIEERISELQRLVDTANETSSALNDLLGLKQQQMGVVEARLEAREAVEQGRETVRQGRTIMLFTVVTIIFMPLSFLASVFGMNVAELNGGTLTFKEEFTYMFPISFGFSLITLAIAFKIYTIP